MQVDGSLKVDTSKTMQNERIGNPYNPSHKLSVCVPQKK